MGRRRVVALSVLVGAVVAATGLPAQAAAPPAAAPGAGAPSCTVRAVASSTGFAADWSAPSTWSPARVPTEADSVCLDGQTVVATRSATVAALHDGGGWTIAAAGVLLTVTRRVDLSGVVGGPGTVVAAEGSSGVLYGEAGLAFHGHLVNRGSLRMAGRGCGPGDKAGSVLDNAGTLTVDDGAFICSGTVVNAPGAVLRVPQGTVRLPFPVVNQGLLRAGARGSLLVDDLTVAGRSGRVVGHVILQTVHVPKPASLGGPWVLLGSVDGPGPLTVPLGASVVLAQGATLDGGVRVVNRGTLRSAGPGTCTTDRAAGSVLENAGTTVLDNGAVVCSGSVVNDAGATLVLPGGVAARVVGPVVNDGTVWVVAGSVLTTASLTSSPLAVLKVGVPAAGGGQAGRVVVSSPTALDGVLVVDPFSGQVPPVGWAGQVVSGSAVTGAFARVFATASAPDRHFAVTSSSTGATLQVVAGAAA